MELLIVASEHME